MRCASVYVMPRLCFVICLAVLVTALVTPGGCASSTDPACVPSTSADAQAVTLPRVAVLRIGNYKRFADYREMHDYGAGLASDWRTAAAMLEVQRADIVVVRFDTFGGRASAFVELTNVLRTEFLPKFRVVAWVHMANEAALLPLLAIQERVFAPNGIAYSNAGWRSDPCSEVDSRDWLSPEDIETFAQTTPDPAWTEALFHLLYGNTAEQVHTPQAWQIEAILGRESLSALKPDTAMQLGVSKGDAAELQGVLAHMGIHEWQECCPEVQAHLDDGAIRRARTLDRLQLLSGQVRSLSRDWLMSPNKFCRESLPHSHKGLHEELVRHAQDSPELMREACLDPAWFQP